MVQGAQQRGHTPCVNLLYNNPPLYYYYSWRGCLLVLWTDHSSHQTLTLTLPGRPTHSYTHHEPLQHTDKHNISGVEALWLGRKTQSASSEMWVSWLRQKTLGYPTTIQFIKKKNLESVLLILLLFCLTTIYEKPFTVLHPESLICKCIYLYILGNQKTA